MEFDKIVDELFGPVEEIVENASSVDNWPDDEFDPFAGFNLGPQLHHEPGPSERIADALREAVEIAALTKDEMLLEQLFVELGFVARNIRWLLRLCGWIATWRLQVLEVIAKIQALAHLLADRALGGDPPGIRRIRLETLNARMRADA